MNTAVILLLDDGRVGHLHQSVALAEALIKAQTKTSTANDIAASAVKTLSLANAGSLARLERLTLVIGCGRQAAKCSLQMKNRFGAKLINIQILNPVARLRQRETAWDWLLIPRHDQVSGTNVIGFLGSLVQQPAPLTTAEGHLLLLLGGATEYLRWDESSLNNWLDEAGKQKLPVTICPSTRTPKSLLYLLRSRVQQNFGWQYVESDDSGAYRSAIAQAAEFWVSGDSINMLAEACASDRPVKALGARLARGKVKRYLQQLAERGRFDTRKPIREAPRVALELIKRGALLGLD